MPVTRSAPARVVLVLAVAVVVAIGVMHGIQAFAHSPVASPSVEVAGGHDSHDGHAPAGSQGARHDHAGSGHGVDGHAAAVLCLVAVLAALVTWRADRSPAGRAHTARRPLLARLVGPEPPVPRLVA